jgi:hypothetical protein
MVAVSSKDAKNALDDAEDVHCTASYVEDRKPRAYRKVTRARWRKFGTRLKRQGGELETVDTLLKGIEEVLHPRELW